MEWQFKAKSVHLLRKICIHAGKGTIFWLVWLQRWWISFFLCERKRKKKKLNKKMKTRYFWCFYFGLVRVCGKKRKKWNVSRYAPRLVPPIDFWHFFFFLFFLFLVGSFFGVAQSSHSQPGCLWTDWNFIFFFFFGLREKNMYDNNNNN